MRLILILMVFLLTSFTTERKTESRTLERTTKSKSESKREAKLASWYGIPFHGRVTATGDIYDMNELTCATTWNAETRRLGYPFGTKLKVTNLSNNKSVIVTVNDTGSFGEKYNRHLDLSKAAFDRIANLDTGVIKIKVTRIK